MKQKFTFKGAMVAIGLFLIAAFFVFYVQQGTINPSDINSVYIPEYTSAWCAPCSTSVQSTITELSSSSSAKVITCDSGYKPKGCTITYEPRSQITTTFGESALYVCNDGVSKLEASQDIIREVSFGKDGIITPDKCTIYSTDKGNLPNNNQKVVKLVQGQFAVVVSDKLATVTENHEDYCLWSLARGKLSTQSSCKISLLSSLVYDFPEYANLEQNYGKDNSIQHVVIGYSAVVNPIDVVNNQYLQFTYGKIQTCDITTDNSGYRYVDTNSCKDTTTYSCVPSLPPAGFACLNGQKIAEVKELNECSGTGLIGYYTNPTTKQNCEMHCESNKQKITQCVDIVDADEGKIIQPPITTPKDYTIFYVLIGALTLIIVAYLFASKKKR